MKAWLKKRRKPLIALTLALVGVMVGPRIWITRQAAPRLYATVQEAPAMPVAIVLGAGLTRNGTPSAMLYDRVRTACDLYKQGKVKKLLMTGDNRKIEYNEPEAMRQAALALGVPSEAIILDYAGRRTYDSCYRARHIFGVQKAVMVTQQFHLSRAVYLGNQLGLDVIGVSADRRVYHTRSAFKSEVREWGACGQAVLDVILKPTPILGKPEPIIVADI